MISRAFCFARLVDFAKQLNEEERRGIREQLDDEQLAIFDILTRPSLKLTKQEREQVKRLARELLDTLKAERLVLPQVAQLAADPRRHAHMIKWLSQRIYAATSIGSADRLKARSVCCPPCFMRSNWAYLTPLVPEAETQKCPLALP